MTIKENLIPKEIEDFISENQVSTICFNDDNNAPYCINCFYVFDKKNEILIFKSSPGTNHHGMIIPNKMIAGTILPEKIDVMKLQGVQLTATIVSEEFLEENKATTNYYIKNPFAVAIPGYIWGVKLTTLKFTDNTLVFGKKTKWQNTIEL
jgi:uncharacterized protein YhbP (UPF0306 family)